ncbi:MAG: GPW/gp25 family protein [Cyclobacteriaceae bacterium]|nr:GPW/gp25 family protein [Cyclobacteriaceae bacterium]
MKRAKSFLGQGWAFPPEFLRDVNSVALSAEEESIRQNLHILFSTQCGEHFMNSEYGTILKTLLFDDPDANMYSAIQDTIRDAIVLYEPRIKLDNVQIEADPDDDSRVNIAVTYTVVTNNSRRNFVYPFHFIEGTNLNR